MFWCRKQNSSPDPVDPPPESTLDFVEPLKDMLVKNRRGFRPPAWSKDEAVQQQIQNERRLDRGYMNESVFKIVFQEAFKGMFSAYELANLFNVPCIRETIVSSLSVGLLASSISYISSRSFRRASWLFAASTSFIMIPSYFSCKVRLGQTKAFSNIVNIANAKGKEVIITDDYKVRKENKANS
ncbi:hypothetical protein V1512DRAFT_263621 [Lipomyces arxii]|uniref:uncharacterized protein n=1 Tax=Lipomyces arxii TaxID=56418 RepID=UPI0034CEA1CF